MPWAEVWILDVGQCLKPSGCGILGCCGSAVAFQVPANCPFVSYIKKGSTATIQFTLYHTSYSNIVYKVLNLFDYFLRLYATQSLAIKV
jgi:hypothetical protein